MIDAKLDTARNESSHAAVPMTHMGITTVVSHRIALCNDEKIA